MSERMSVNEELKKGLKALRLECPEAVCADLERLVWAAIDEASKDTARQFLPQVAEIKEKYTSALKKASVALKESTKHILDKGKCDACRLYNEAMSDELIHQVLEGEK